MFLRLCTDFVCDFFDIEAKLQCKNGCRRFVAPCNVSFRGVKLEPVDSGSAFADFVLEPATFKRYILASWSLVLDPCSASSL